MSKIAEYPNFYENLKEAQARLQGTVVMYDGEPVYISQITDHMKDGIFRVYCLPLAMNEDNSPRPVLQDLVYHAQNQNVTIGKKLDEWMDANPQTKMVRKYMNSPKFNKFRPFPLGMVNQGDNVYYVERQPVRPKMEQGLTASFLTEHKVALVESSLSGIYKSGGGPRYVDMYSTAFRDTILGKYPTALECLTNLLDEDVTNSGAAFHRYFAFVRGPMKMIFLAYKTEIIGVLPCHNFQAVTLGKDFKHLREVTEELNLFTDITIQS